MARHVHLVGSIGLDTTEDVFEEVGGQVGKYVLRCPDGEVAARKHWLLYQLPLFRANPVFAPDPATFHPEIGLAQMRLKDGAATDSLHFGELGYAREARLSYQLFVEARKAGKFPPTTRFQVSLPTPIAVVSAFVRFADAPKVVPAYTAAMVREVERMCAAIPHKDLAIQWDVCHEMIMWDGRHAIFAPFPGMEQVFATAFETLGSVVPADVHLGFHLCYGDIDAKHMIEPEDLGKAVGLANLIVRNVHHRIDWVHMPVPIGRGDDAYFAPLKQLQLQPKTELFLGLVHEADGVEGTRHRMAAAQKVRQEFGIATECGMSRARTKDHARKLLRIHAEAAR